MVKLLIVDDESRTRTGLSSLIAKSRLPIEIVGIAANGEEGLSLAKSLLPDIILTDVRMPRLDGIRLSSEVKKFSPDCQIIFISGYADKEYLKAAISLKAVSYVEKPIEEQEIIGALTNAIHNIEENRQKSNILKQNELLQKQQKDMLRTKAALEFIRPGTDQQDLSMLSSLHPDFWEHPCYCTLICCLNDKEGEMPRAQDALETVLGKYSNPYLLAAQKPGLFILHVCGIEQNQTDTFHIRMDLLFEKMRTALSSLSELFLAVERPVPSPGQLHHSYADAVVCLKQLFFTGFDHISYFKGMDNSAETPFCPDETLYLEFIRTLQEGDRQKADAIVTQLFREIRQMTCFEINSIKNVYHRLLLALDSVCQKRGLSDVLPHDGDFIWENISQSDTVFSLHTCLTDRLTFYFDILLGREGSSLLIYHIRQYVEEHFKEPNLSVNQLAADLHFSTAYLCRSFKIETGDTINAYINSFRIGKAKELLLTEDIKLYEISFCVGYSDPNYFTRQFKKQVGMTPSEYRERHAL